MKSLNYCWIDFCQNVSLCIDEMVASHQYIHASSRNIRSICMPKSSLYVCVTNGFRVSQYVHEVLLLGDKQKQPCQGKRKLSKFGFKGPSVIENVPRGQVLYKQPFEIGCTDF